MPNRKEAPELTFQQHVANYLVREHGYGVLEQSEITDSKYFIAETEDCFYMRERKGQLPSPQEIGRLLEEMK
jgi:hypothetical protein